LNLAADVPKKMVLLNVFDDGLVDGDAEFMKPGADISVDEVNMELLNSCAGFTQPYAAGTRPTAMAPASSRRSRALRVTLTAWGFLTSWRRSA